jgi:hypothetical protein
MRLPPPKALPVDSVRAADGAVTVARSPMLDSWPKSNRFPHGASISDIRERVMGPRKQPFGTTK